MNPAIAFVIFCALGELSDSERTLRKHSVTYSQLPSLCD
jgi:hypothetical protein